MTGALMQLVSYGAQDLYLSGNPLLTYFKTVYRRHSNFTMESIMQSFNGPVAFGAKVSALIYRCGDLINNMILEVNLPAIKPDAFIMGANNLQQFRWVSDLGHHLISRVGIEIGGQVIDEHYSDWLEIWAQLTEPAGKKIGYREMIGQTPGTKNNALSGLQTNSGSAIANSSGLGFANSPDNLIFIPLQFWFCRNIGLSLPLIALQYHEVRVNIDFAQASTVIINHNNMPSFNGDINVVEGALSANLWVDYIYVDIDERHRFADIAHEYLIEQVQFLGNELVDINNNPTVKNINLHFEHCIKEILWVGKTLNVPGMEPSNYTFSDTTGQTSIDTFAGRNNIAECGCSSKRAQSPVIDAVLTVNGLDRFEKRDGSYFNLVETMKHSNIPDSRGIYVYSFSMFPEAHQPSGTCNFSRLSSTSLKLTLSKNNVLSTVKIYATNYNVLRIISGMGGLAYV